MNFQNFALFLDQIKLYFGHDRADGGAGNDGKRTFLQQ